MKRRDLWKLSLLNIFASPVRSILTVLGMAIGVAAILAVLTLGEAGKTQVRSEMARLGIDRVWITASGEEKLRFGSAEMLAEKLNMKTAQAVYINAEAICEEQCKDVMIIGCDAGYLSMSGAEIAQGRALWPLEWEADSRCLLLGARLARSLQAGTGSVLYLQGKGFRVCGIVQAPDAFSNIDMESAVFVPVRTLEGLLGGTVHEIILEIPPHTVPQDAAAMARSVMQSMQNTSVETMTLQVQMEAAQSVITTFVQVLKWVALVCVLVGGIGVMNILLVSVRERRREIGIMKSLGTTHRQICTLFLLEALSYALIGGVLGIVIGHGIILAAGHSIGLNAQADAADCVWVLFCALLTGLFFGVTPASRAAGLSCVDALREE